MRRFVGYDPITGLTTWHEYDHVTKDTLIHTTYDHAQTDAVLDMNHRLQNLDDGGWDSTKSWRRVAEIPMSVIHWFMVHKKIDLLRCDSKTLKKIMNDSDWRKLRTANWHV
jgi:hypothetical protein